MCVKLPMTPNTLRSHITAIITTTTLRILLMFCCIGIYEFTNQRITPATIRTIRIVKSGMIIMYLIVYKYYITKMACFMKGSVTQLSQ